LVEIFTKISFDLHDSKREEKLLSSSDFVTAARVVQQPPKLNRTTVNHRWCNEALCRLPRPSRFARLPWVIYTSHSSYSYYCTY